MTLPPENQIMPALPALPTPQAKKSSRMTLVLLAAVSMVLFLAVSADVFFRGRLYHMDVPLARRIYGPISRADDLRHLCAALTNLGGLTFSITVGGVVAAVLFALGRGRLLVVWGVALLGSAGMNWMMKNHFAEPRPLLLSQFPLDEGFTYPSGHTMAAVMTFGMIAYVLTMEAPHWRTLWVICAGVIILAVASSLWLLGVHYMTDILGGLTAAIGWLFLVIALLGPERAGA